MFFKSNQYAYALRGVHDQEHNALRQCFAMDRAESFTAFQDAIAMLQFPMGNITYAASADATHPHGQIGYLWGGAVPDRIDDSADYSQYVDGSLPETDWQGIHPASDLPAVVNPASHWLANNNVAANQVTDNSGIDLTDYPAYMVSGHQDDTTWRQLRLTELIHQQMATATPVDQSTMEAWASDTYDTWAGAAIPLILAADAELAQACSEVQTQDSALNCDLMPVALSLLEQHLDQGLDASTTSPTMLFWRGVQESFAFATGHALLSERPNQFPAVLPATERAAAAVALVTVADYFLSHGLTENPPIWGDYQRIMQGSQSFAVGGGPEVLRSANSSWDSATQKMVYGGGQVFVMVVALGNSAQGEPTHSRFYKALGVSEYESSSHFLDLTEDFSHDTFRDFYDTPVGLYDHLESETLLTLPLDLSAF